ncbi:hypothetical protein PJL15_01415 [Paenarthrobacter nitroguajacolicus]|nr:hypothetical protein [Paenarthrobacter nitroguajacolicus]
MTARTEPTSAVSSSLTRISWRVPATGEGISVSTLSVETSRRGSSTSTVSPTALSQRVTVPSVTLSPKAGRVTSWPSPPEAAGAASWAGAAGASSAAGASAAAGAASWAGAAGASSAGAASAAEPEPSPMRTKGAPTSAVSSSATRISSMTPEIGEGISVSTLSVETSSNGSSISTRSPTCLSQRVTVPSVTLSPRAGKLTDSDMSSPFSLLIFVRMNSAGPGRVHPADSAACTRPVCLG